MKELSIRQIQAQMTSGQLTSELLVQSYLSRIEAFDPMVNAIIEINPDARSIARSLDQERSQGHVRGPMHGIPVLVKDNIETSDKMQTTAGSLALEGHYAKQDAFIIAKLRQAGAIILGKTNLSEWANFRGHKSTSGWSSRGGLTRNPYYLDRSACGSSSGSAVSVAANFCSVAIGTETDGSIICPSQTNGIVGFKPTRGLLSRTGIIPVALSQDMPGPMARSVEDVAFTLEAMIGEDISDLTTLDIADHVTPHFVNALDSRGLRGARIGIARNMSGSNQQDLQILDKAVSRLEKLGATVIDPIIVPHVGQFSDAELKVLHFEFKDGLNRYLKGVPNHIDIRSIDDVISFNEKHRDRVMPYFGQEHMIDSRKKSDLADQSYLNALAKSRLLAGEQGLRSAIEEHQLDAIVCLSGGKSWQIDLFHGDSHPWDTMATSGAAVAGYPHITIPGGYIYGLPVGLSFIGLPWQDAKVIKYAYAMEQRFPVRQPPEFLKSVED